MRLGEKEPSRLNARGEELVHQAKLSSINLTPASFRMTFFKSQIQHLKKKRLYRRHLEYKFDPKSPGAAFGLVG